MRVTSFTFLVSLSELFLLRGSEGVRFSWVGFFEGGELLLPFGAFVGLVPGFVQAHHSLARITFELFLSEYFLKSFVAVQQQQFSFTQPGQTIFSVHCWISNGHRHEGCS